MLRVLAQATFITAIATLLVKLAGFGKDLCIARFFGLSAEIDLFLLLFSATLLLSAIVSGSAVYTLQPIIAHDKAKGDPAEAHFLAQQILTIVAMTLFVLGVAACALWSLGVRPAFSAIDPQLVALLPWAFIPYLILNGTAAILQAVGNSHQLFFRCGVVGAITPLVTVLLLYSTQSNSLWLLTAAIVLGALLELVVFRSIVHRTGFVAALKFPLWNARLKQVLISSAFLTVGYVANSLNIMVDQLMAMQFGEGAVATLTFASKLPALIVGVLGFAAATAFLPTISSIMANGEGGRALHLVRQATLALGLLGIICAAGLGLPAEALTSLLFERGAFNSADVERVAGVMQLYSLLPLATMIGLPANRVLVALGLSRILMLWSVGGVALNVLLNLLFGRWIGLPGLALSTVVVAATVSIGLLVITHQRLRSCS